MGCESKLRDKVIVSWNVWALRQAARTPSSAPAAEGPPQLFLGPQQDDTVL